MFLKSSTNKKALFLTLIIFFTSQIFSLASEAAPCQTDGPFEYNSCSVVDGLMIVTEPFVRSAQFGSGTSYWIAQVSGPAVDHLCMRYGGLKNIDEITQGVSLQEAAVTLNTSARLTGLAQPHSASGYDPGVSLDRIEVLTCSLH